MNKFYIDDINKTVNLSFSYDEDLKNKVKSIDNSRWNDELKEWIIPVNKLNKAYLQNFLRKYNFVKKIIETSDVKYSYNKSDAERSLLKDICDKKGFKYIPRDYQLDCLSYQMEKEDVIVGDSVGLGKTAESIFYTEVENKFPCLVITPGSVKYNWSEKWTEIVDNPKRTISVIESNKDNDWSSDVVIINYDIIAKKAGKGATTKFTELKTIDWKMIIFDEAHFLKEKKSQRSQASKIILKNNSGNVQMLTGTAIMSKPIEIWNMLVLMGKDKDIANDWMHFVRRYCGAYRGKFGWVTSGATNILELNKKLRESCYIRREKSDVLKELPKVIKQVINIPITNSTKIKKAKNNFVEYIKNTKGQEASEKAMEAEHLVAISELRKLAIEGKLKAIEQYIKDWRATTDKKLLIFGVHKEPLDILSNKFKSNLISGGVSSKNKQKIVNDWITSKDQFLFANGDAAGTGVDGLQRSCSDMIIIELPWRPSDLEQWVGRIDRSGQTEPPNINFLLNNDTIDKDMWGMLEIKERVMSAVNQGKDIKSSTSSLKYIIKNFLKN